MLCYQIHLKDLITQLLLFNSDFLSHSNFRLHLHNTDRSLPIQTQPFFHLISNSNFLPIHLLPWFRCYSDNTNRFPSGSSLSSSNLFHQNNTTLHQYAPILMFYNFHHHENTSTYLLKLTTALAFFQVTIHRKHLRNSLLSRHLLP